MRQLTIAALFAFAVGAFAQEGEQVRPRLDVPGERSVERQLSISPARMEAWELTDDDKAALKDKLVKLNKARAELIAKLKGAREKMAEAKKGLHRVLAELDQQEAALYAFIKPMLPDEKQADFALRVKLQPLIDWLQLSEGKAAELVTSRKFKEAVQAAWEAVQVAEAMESVFWDYHGRSEKNPRACTVAEFFEDFDDDTDEQASPGSGMGRSDTAVQDR